MLSLATPVEQLTKVGKTTAGRLKSSLGVFNVLDLIYYFPFRYDDFSQVKNIADLHPGDIATAKGKIELLANKRSPRKRMMITECLLTDETGSVKAIWFRQPFIAKTLTNGDEVYFSGKVEGNLFALSFQNPSYEKVSSNTTHTARLVPIYPLTEGISQKQIRFLIKQALNAVAEVADRLPAKIKQGYDLIGLTEALANIHFPKNQTALNSARARLQFDELLELQLQNYLIKKDLAAYTAQPLKFNEEKTKELVAGLGFTLTAAQKKAAWQILQDMEKPQAMNRLLAGDVGSGKTAVAALAILNCVLNSSQAALFTPTEILAAQHFKSLKELLKPLNCNVALLTSSQKQVYNTADLEPSGLTKKQLVASIGLGEIDLIIGTQAIIQKEVEFKNLGLVVIDEQHRFGVEQRQALREKSGPNKSAPHLLSMTATPIPRTLALTVYGDLDISLINELPPGRKTPITRLVEPKNRELAYEFVLKQIASGRQGFVICPIISESDKLGVKAATEEYQKLAEEIFPQLKLGLLHGKLKPKEKNKAMADFASGKTDILVATSVVEVGVNVPNANIMIIESAQRFGLSQLHQFRGRVNRANYQSYCLLFTEGSSAKTDQRLNTLANCYDGLKLAEEDLRARGMGNLTGTLQSGFGSGLKIASLGDLKLIEQTKQALQTIIREFPEILEKYKTENRVHPE
ncbi:MAG: ATP-dependent DNA helicase RecG [Candidatus Komeilibacteria bacterium]|nr:ATP-dependent DNA helicase RecG [Candidatus Komeilibacteria bacterium]